MKKSHTFNKSILLFALVIINVLISHAQNLTKSINIQLENASLTEVFKTIEIQTDFTVLYKDTELENQKTVSISGKNIILKDLLDKILINRGLFYRVYGKIIIIVKQESTSNEKKLIVGTIKDKNGQPIIGANIFIKEKSIGTVSDENGYFSFYAEENDQLIFSYIGFKKVFVRVGKNANLNVTLLEEENDIGEIVAIGYGAMPKGLLSSAVSTIKNEEISNNTVNDVSNAIGGKTAGLILRNWNAEPGSDASTIYIRGPGTMGDNSPLIVVDGIAGRELSLLNMEDIESISILKDASAVAPYGSRGANGVILVNTKRGKENRQTVAYKNYIGIESPTILPQFCNSWEYASLYNEAAMNEGKTELPFTNAQIARFREANTPEYPNTDWWNALLRKNPVQQMHNLSIAGGNKELSYYISSNYFQQQGFFNQVDFSKYSIKCNIDSKISESLKLSFDLTGYIGDRSTTTSKMFDFLQGF